METTRMGVTIDRQVKGKAEAAILANGMCITEYIRRVMAYAACGGDLSIIAARPSGIRNGVKAA